SAHFALIDESDGMAPCLGHHTFRSIVLRLPPPPSSTLFPYTTLFRSTLDARNVLGDHCGGAHCLAVADARPPCRNRLGSRHRRRSEKHTSELQSRFELVCRLLLEKKNLPHYKVGFWCAHAKRHRSSCA